MNKNMIEIPCPECGTLAHPTQEEAIGEDYLIYWYCNLSFKNPNYIETK